MKKSDLLNFFENRIDLGSSESIGSDEDSKSNPIEDSESDVEMDWIDVKQEDVKIFNYEKWTRPLVSTLNPDTDALIFQQIDIQQYIIENESPQDLVPVIRMFGTTTQENSVCCTIHGFRPYFYMTMPSGFEPKDCDILKKQLNKASDQNYCILNIEIVERYNIYGYRGEAKLNFLKITYKLSRNVKSIQHVLIARNLADRGDFFECDVDFVMRFMVDSEMVSCSWIELPPKKWKLMESEINDGFQSYCQLEVACDYRDFVSHKAEGDWSKIAPLRILSFEVVCASQPDQILNPDVDSTIQIANMMFRHEEAEPFLKNIFVLNECAPINGVDIISLNDERKLLLEWSKFIRLSDPDIITGFNISNFDISYLINRARRLCAFDFEYLGRIKNIRTKVKAGVFKSRQIGCYKNSSINLEGRVIFDLYKILRREYKLRSYSPNYASFYFLGETKEDIHQRDIAKLYNGDHFTRQRLAKYCLKSAQLSIKLMNKLMCVVNYVEMARVTGIPLGMVLHKGQIVRVFNQLLIAAKKKDFLLSTAILKDIDYKYKGGYVLEPKVGYYSHPITILDFASMYPNIMITYNLCHSTLLYPGMQEKLGLSDDDIQESPAGYTFVKSSIRKGLLPEILTHLLKARKTTKEAFKAEQDPNRRAILDGRQQAIKLIANSVYGFTGTQVGGKLPCLEVACSVTSYGRSMINKTKEEIEAHYTRRNGCENDAQVIYGDTDSVMINFGVKSIKNCIDLGQEAAKHVTSVFNGTIMLEYENVFSPYLLIGKKRYVGLKYTTNYEHDGIVTKGIETVRRDSPLIVKNLLEKCLKMLFIDCDLEGAIDYTKSVISDLLCDRLDLHQLIITKGSSSGTSQKNFSSDSSTLRRLDARMPFIVCASDRKISFEKKIKDPICVMEENLPIDVKYYLETYLSRPLLDIFKLIIGSEAEAILLKGDHIRVRRKTISKSSPLANFIIKSNTCLSCNVPLSGPYKNAVTCSKCEPKKLELYQQELNRQRVLENKFWGVQTECQRCQGSIHQNILCSSRDCPLFYMRKKLEIDLNNQNKTIERFGLPAYLEF